MKKYLFLLTLLSAACATVKENSDTKLKPREALSVEVTKKFTEPVSAVLLSKAKAGNCDDLNSKLKNKWNWTLALEATSVCYKSKNLTLVSVLAQDLAIKEPNSPWGPYWLALLAYDADQKERAEWMIELSYSRGAESAAVNYLRGQIQWNAKKHREAVASFEKATLIDRSLYSAQIFLGQIYYQEQEFEKALERFNLALFYDSKNPAALYGYAESALQQKNTVDALSTLAKLGDREPSDAKYFLRMAEIQQNIVQDSVGAMKTYKKLQKNIKAGLVQKNLDPQMEIKIKQLELQVANMRDVATSKEK